MAHDDRTRRESSLARTARLATLPAAFVGRTTWGMGKRLVGQPADAVLSQVQQRTADQIFSVLGQLKGGAMKAGQAMSVFEAALPEELIGPYRETLTRLQNAAPPMPASTVNDVLTTNLGDDWRQLLPTFDETPAAAASIGQVHRGVWHDGQDVAVKIQYPGAADALEADLRQVGRAARLLGTLTPGIDVNMLVHELQERMTEEVDYTLEASAQQIFADEFDGDPHIAIGHVLDYTDHVLVNQWLDADGTLAQMIGQSTQDERNRLAEHYVRFLFSGPARTGMLHADPHPGNFLVMPDGRMAVVDFGAVSRLPDGLPPIIGRLLRHAVDHDYDAVTEGLRDEGFLKPGVDIDTDILSDYLDPFVEPARSEYFAFNRDWMRRQLQRISARSSTGIGTAIKINLPPEYLLIHRVWIGGVGVLCQLEAEAPFRQIMIDSLPGFAD